MDCNMEFEVASLSSVMDWVEKNKQLVTKFVACSDPNSGDEQYSVTLEVEISEPEHFKVVSELVEWYLDNQENDLASAMASMVSDEEDRPPQEA